MRKNGQIVVGQVDLKHGDVLEMHVPLGFQPFNLSLVSPKVQICLDASIPGPTSAFKEDDYAFEVITDHTWKDELRNGYGGAWSPIPDGVDIHPATWEALHVQRLYLDETVLLYELYVGGSTGHDSSAWAVVAAAVTETGRTLRGCLSGVTALNPADQLWIGARQHTNIDAELSGMVVASAFALFCQNEYSVTVRPDLALSNNFARCLSATKSSHPLVHLLQASRRIAEILKKLELQWKKFVHILETRGMNLLIGLLSTLCFKARDVDLLHGHLSTGLSRLFPICTGVGSLMHARRCRPHILSCMTRLYGSRPCLTAESALVLTLLQRVSRN